MSNKGYLAIIGILVLTIAGLGYKYYSDQKKASIEIDGLTQDFNTSDVERGMLEVKLEKMLIGYDTLKTENSMMLDKISQQKLEIEDMLQKLKNKGAQVYQLNQQAETMTRLMKGYIHEIDSLNTLNKGLQEQVGDLTKAVTERDDKIIDLEEDNDNLTDLKEKSKVLQTTMMTSIGVRYTNSGNQKQTNRSGRTDMIKTCFTILKNVFAEVGKKTIYLKVVDSNGQVLPAKGGVKTETFEGVQSPYSASREIDFTQDMMDVCVYYDVQNELSSGDYTIFAYEGGKQIGSTDISLK